MISVDKLVIAVEVVTKAAEKAMTEFEKQLNSTRKAINLQTRAHAAGLDKSAKLTKANAMEIAKFEARTTAFEKTFRNVQRLMLSTGLSFLFTGMAIKRFFESMLRSLFDTFLMVEGEGGIVNNKVNELKAAFWALQAQFVEAADKAGVLDKWKDRIEGILGWFEKLSDKQKATFVDMSINAAIAGSSLMVIGQVGLGLIGVMAALDVAMAPVSLSFMIIGVLAYTIYKTIDGDLNPILKIFVVTLGLIAAAMIVCTLAEIGLTLPLLVIIAVVALIIASIIVLSKELGGLKNMFKWVGLGIAEIFIAVLETVELAIIGIIKLLNLIPGINITEPEIYKTTKKLREQQKKIGWTGGASGSWEETGGVTGTNPFMEQYAKSSGEIINNITVQGDVYGQEGINNLIKQLESRINFKQGSTSQ